MGDGDQEVQTAVIPNFLPSTDKMVKETIEDHDFFMKGLLSERDYLSLQIKRQTQLQEKLKSAQTDELTKLLVRKSWMEIYREVFKTISEAPTGTFSIIMADVEGLKRANDKYGHDVGDLLLIKVAEVLRKGAKRNTDFISIEHKEEKESPKEIQEEAVGRYGGDEFTVLLPGTPKEGALIVAQGIQNFLMEAQKVTGENQFPRLPHLVTMSLGIANYEKGITPEELIKRADDAMYKAKKHTKSLPKKPKMGSIAIFDNKSDAIILNPEAKQEPAQVPA